MDTLNKKEIFFNRAEIKEAKLLFHNLKLMT